MNNKPIASAPKKTMAVSGLKPPSMFGFALEAGCTPRIVISATVFPPELAHTKPVIISGECDALMNREFFYSTMQLLNHQPLSILEWVADNRAACAKRCGA